MAGRRRNPTTPRALKWAVQTRVTEMKTVSIPAHEFPGGVLFEGLSDIRHTEIGQIGFLGLKTKGIGRFRVVFIHRDGRWVVVNLEADVIQRDSKWASQNGVELYGGSWRPLDGDNGLVGEALAYFKASRDRAALRAEKSKKASSLGGRAPKYAKAVMAKIVQILRRAPNMRSKEVFKTFSDAREKKVDVTVEGITYRVYRDGNTLVQIDPQGNERAVRLKNFLARYVPKARRIAHSK